MGAKKKQVRIGGIGAVWCRLVRKRAAEHLTTNIVFWRRPLGSLGAARVARSLSSS